MFSNVGETIKKYAVAMVVIQYVVIALAAIYFIAAGINSDGLFMLYFVLTLVIGGIACVFVAFSGSIIYAYGDMADCVAEIYEKLKKPIPVYITGTPQQATTAAQNTTIDPEMIKIIYQLPANELQRLLSEKKGLLKDKEIALIEDALIQRAKSGE